MQRLPEGLVRRLRKLPNGIYKASQQAPRGCAPSEAAPTKTPGCHEANPPTALHVPIPARLELQVDEVQRLQSGYVLLSADGAYPDWHEV